MTAIDATLPMKETDETMDSATIQGTPSHDEIAALAYEYWQSREGEEGSAEADWLQAERFLTERQAK
jgi:hypothetical protein